MRVQNDHRQNLKTMMIMREFERVIKDLANQGYVEGAVHCYTGEEAVALGVCLNLEDSDYILSKWLESWTSHYDTIKFAQEIDPISGEPTKSSEWYSSCMLSYLYGARRLGLV